MRYTDKKFNVKKLLVTISVRLKLIFLEKNAIEHE